MVINFGGFEEEVFRDESLIASKKPILNLIRGRYPVSHGVFFQDYFKR